MDQKTIKHIPYVEDAVEEHSTDNLKCVVPVDTPLQEWDIV